MKNISKFAEYYSKLCTIVGCVVITFMILGGFKFTLGNRVIEFDGLLEIILGPFFIWLFKV